MKTFEMWPPVVSLELRPWETNTVVEVLKAHREHCRKIKPEAASLLRTLDDVIERIERQKVYESMAQ